MGSAPYLLRAIYPHTNVARDAGPLHDNPLRPALACYARPLPARRKPRNIRHLRSCFDELRRREAAHSAILYAFDLIEHDGQDLRYLPFLDRRAALTRLLRDKAVWNELVGYALARSSSRFKDFWRDLAQWAPAVTAERVSGLEA
jgi:hypothetical protein